MDPIGEGPVILDMNEVIPDGEDIGKPGGTVGNPLPLGGPKT